MFLNFISFIFNKKTQKNTFWIVIITCLLLGLGPSYAKSSGADAGNLVINEFLAANGTGLVDEDGEYSDWIEIYNRGDQAVSLAGWSLTNDPNQPGKWFFPEINLDSHDYLVVFASGKNRMATEPGTALHTNFKLSKNGDFLGLYSILEDKFMDVISPQFPEQFRDVSYGRHKTKRTFGYLTTPTPGWSNDETAIWTGTVSPVKFSIERGIYDTPIAVELATDSAGATIYYTTDGSVPTETNGITYAGPITIEATTLLRAVALKSDLLPSSESTQSYIFLDDVLNQSSAPPGLPPSWGTQLTDVQGVVKAAPVTARYGMNPDVVDDPRYRDTIKDDFESLPTLSLVMETQSFTDLLLHPQEIGRRSEQPVSVELIYPDNQKSDLQINAGIRPYSNMDQATPTPKRSYRLFFRGDYGATQLVHTLYPDSPVETFNTLILEAAGNNPNGGTNPAEGRICTRNEWLRASQVAMSNLGPHDMFVHLYINGLYWGLYNVTERPDESFMSSYMGGKKEDWFIANQEGPLSDTPGSQASILNYLFTTLSLAPRMNSELEQQDFLAETYASIVPYLDTAQFSDYMILNLYAESLNWSEPDWYVAINLKDLSGQGKFLLGNGYNSAHPDGSQSSAGLANGTRHNIAKSLFEMMMKNSDFRMQFADRLYKHLFNNGMLSDANAQVRWLHLNNTIVQAIVAESARWGDTGQKPTLTENNWLKSRDKVLAQMEGNAAGLIALAREIGYYPKINPPVFSQKGSLVEAGFSLEMSLASATSPGTIYYTTDGTDPRLPVTEEVSPNAVAYNTSLVFTNNTSVKARVFDGEVWSALHAATFNVVEQDNKLRITEIMYNPAAGDDYEFIEIKNVGNNEVNLANVTISDGIYFAFPSNTPPLAPGDFAVLVKNPTAFAKQYPDVTISGIYDGSLSNKGESFVLVDAKGQILLEVNYDDRNGWPITPDGRGDSLVLVDPSGDLNSPSNWRASTVLNGSPGADEPKAN